MPQKSPTTSIRKAVIYGFRDGLTAGHVVDQVEKRMHDFLNNRFQVAILEAEARGEHGQILADFLAAFLKTIKDAK